MSLQRVCFAALTVALCLVVGPSLAVAGTFFTDNFNYSDGDLTTVSGGLWTGHSGNPPDIQVTNGQAIVTSPGSMDDNRLTGSVMGSSDIWYYAAKFVVDIGDSSSINEDYFIHFKDDSVFGFNARLALDSPSDSEKDFSLSILASSAGDGQADWDGDFEFGDELIAVVEWNNGTGDATLWVNPVDMSSTSITDTELPDAMRDVESLALRQDSGSSSIVAIDVVSVGDDFDDVLAAVPEPSSLALLGLVSLVGAFCFRRRQA